MLTPVFLLQIKIGDFGLATRVESDGERKRTLCGTPNYIAPEVLGKKGHSFEVDVWSIGCILYTLLVGKPPFETQTLKDTYARIKRNEYHVPSRIGPAAKNLISKLLQVQKISLIMPLHTSLYTSDKLYFSMILTSVPQSRRSCRMTS